MARRLTRADNRRSPSRSILVAPRLTRVGESACFFVRGFSDVPGSYRFPGTAAVKKDGGNGQGPTVFSTNFSSSTFSAGLVQSHLFGNSSFPKRPRLSNALRSLLHLCLRTFFSPTSSGHLFVSASSPPPVTRKTNGPQVDVFLWVRAWLEHKNATTPKSRYFCGSALDSSRNTGDLQVGVFPWRDA